MNTICEKSICTGCGLCAFLCPKHCISLHETGSLGHLYPEIDQQSCINCKLCQKHCPALLTQEKHPPLQAFAGWSSDEADYRSSSSGGAASVLSRYVISLGGVVYGCSMLPDINVKHIRVTNIEGIQLLKGSKYVQSDLQEIYPFLKKDVSSGRLTLFIGTPCQVSAIKSLFGDQVDNLITADLICHGVPSIQALRRHIKKVVKRPHYDSVSFRDGTEINITVITNGETVYHQSFDQPRYKDWYINAFMDGCTFRDSCYSCPYACPERVSDITLGDFWGLGASTPANEIPEHENGCSLIMPNTEKGKNAINDISSQMRLFERPVSEAINGNSQLQKPYHSGIRSRTVRKLYPILGRSAYYLVFADQIIIYSIRRLFHNRFPAC